ncbi:MAG: asparagine synthase-related protein [Candidatus Omnitrophota bacterium]
MQTYVSIAREVKSKIIQSIKNNKAQGILFSGGLDTGIIVAIFPKLPCINIQLENFSTDLTYAQELGKIFDLKIYFLTINAQEVIDAIPEVIRILKSFDPALPNDLAVYFGLKFAKEKGINSLLTGDGADELFAGYDYMRQTPGLAEYIRYISRRMLFSSNKLGEYLGVGIKQPFISKSIVDLAVNELSCDLKIAKYDEKIFGKWILRKAFEDILSPNIAWQTKRPLEIGSGMTQIRKIIADKISDNEFAKKKKEYGIDFYTKDHFYYYEIYKQVIGDIPIPLADQEICPSCGAGFFIGSLHCYTCGWVKKWE